MAVDLEDLVASLRREISPPGQDLYPGATDDMMVGYLADALWEAQLNGLISGYTELDGLLTPTSGATDMPRDLQQLLVLYAGYRIVLASLRNFQSMFRAKAGPVEFETATSATMLRDVLAALRAKIDLLLDLLSNQGATSTAVFDAVLIRTYCGTWIR